MNDLAKKKCGIMSYITSIVLGVVCALIAYEMGATDVEALEVFLLAALYGKLS